MERRPSYSHARKGARGFYAEVPPFSAFVEFTDPSHYVVAPDDWHVVIADIEGSTDAIAGGRYKDVNMLGAACITTVLNAVDAADVPFVFGGDGATLLIPPTAEAPVRAALAGLSRLADTTFGMALRVGMVPVATLVDRGRSVLVARFELSPGNHMALFTGGGVELAESLLKDGAQETGIRFEINAADAAEPDLSGLSCRWEPLTARNGVMMATDNSGSPIIGSMNNRSRKKPMNPVAATARRKARSHPHTSRPHRPSGSHFTGISRIVAT